MQILDDGGYAISGRFDIPGEGESNFVFARGWLVEIVEVEQGEYRFISDGKEVSAARRRFGVFYPPFSLIRTFVKDAKGIVRGVGAVERPAQLPTTPFIFETDFDSDFTAISEASEVLASARRRRSIEVNTSPSLISIKAKRLIDENYLIYPSISRIAARMKVSPEHLSRQFKRDLGISPSSYLHQLRVADATFRLSVGEEIIDISHEVGYNDLSRFYKQFRKSTRSSPAACRKILSR